MKSRDKNAHPAVIDACVLINLAIVDRLPILENIPGARFLVLEDVRSEVTEPSQRSRMERAIEDGKLDTTQLKGEKALETYAELRRVLGKGDAACVAYAEANECFVATDDRRMMKEIDRRCGKGRTITTPGLIVLAIRAGVITIEQADEIKNKLEENSFVMNFGSFHEKAKP